MFFFADIENEHYTEIIRHIRIIANDPDIDIVEKEEMLSEVASQARELANFFSIKMEKDGIDPFGLDDGE